MEQKIKQLKIANQKLARNSRGSNVFESIHDNKPMTIDMSDESANVEETSLFKKVTIDLIESGDDTSSSSQNYASVSLLMLFSAYVIKMLL